MENQINDLFERMFSKFETYEPSVKDIISILQVRDIKCESEENFMISLLRVCSLKRSDGASAESKSCSNVYYVSSMPVQLWKYDLHSDSTLVLKPF